MKAQDIQFRDQRVLTLIFDLLHLLEIGATGHSLPLQNAAARAAITNAALLLECAANSCLLALALPGKLAEEIDRLPTFAKLDYFLFAVAARHIDRTCRESELAAEVLKIRNHIVHPKPKGGVLVGDLFSGYVDYGTTNATRIPLDTRQWSVSIALPLVQSVFAFAKKYFLRMVCI